jgi:hypothetical protein
MKSRNINRRNFEKRKKDFQKIISETVRIVLQEDNEEFYKIQQDVSADGRTAYSFKTKHNPFHDKESDASVSGKETEHSWINGFLNWAADKGLRSDVVKNVTKLVGSGNINPDFETSQESDYQALYDQGDAIVDRQRGESSGDVQNGKAILQKTPLTNPTAVVDLFKGLDAQQGADVQAALLNGENDGDGEADKVKVSAVDAPVSEMKATQTFIDAAQSVAFPLAKSSSYINYIKEDNKAHPAGGRISVAGPFILDGHHRWSGMYAVNPTLKIQAVDFDFSNVSGATKEDAEMALANMQKAVGTMVEPGNPLPGKSGNAALNILDKSLDKIEKMLRSMYENKQGEEGPVLTDEWCAEVMGDQAAVAKIVEKCAAASITEGQSLASDPSVNTIRESVIKLVSYNLYQLVQNSGSPIGTTPQDLPREMMPQLDHPSIGGDQGLNAIRQNLSQGRIDISEGIDLRRWNKLAGLLKD